MKHDLSKIVRGSREQQEKESILLFLAHALLINFCLRTNLSFSLLVHTRIHTCIYVYIYIYIYIYIYVWVYTNILYMYMQSHSYVCI